MKEYTIKQLAEGFELGKWTSLDLVRMYLERIEKLDSNGPKLNSIAEINPDLYEIARELDAERQTNGPRSLLHGIPLVIKDNINTHDGMHTTAGSLALADFIAPYDAHLVTLLKKAGAILLGKANLSEFAYFMSFDDMPSGYGSRFGQVKCPYSDKIDPLGSSTGSAVAVAANLIPIAIGTETNGSLTAPAQNNSIVAIKPTLGLVSRTGIIPISHLQDTAGPLTRTVEDSAILLEAIVGRDPADASTLKTPDKSYHFSQTFDKPIDDLVLGFLTFDNITYDDEEVDILEEAKTILGYKAKAIKQVHFEHLQMPNHKSLIYEFKADLNHYFSTVKGSTKITSLKDLIEFNKQDPEHCLKHGQSIFEAAEETSGTLQEAEYLEIRKQLVIDANVLNRIMEEQGIDVIVMNRRTSHAPIAGNPIVAVPAKALTDETPRSLFFVAKNFSDDQCIRVAYQYEQSTKKRIPPKSSETRT
ncbi:MAG: amidase [Bacilli bacterium]|nr:amidase [Bacilli bacterium]MBN2877481.1 amidase [Bacilli bacterium]